MILGALWAGWGLCCQAACLLWWAAGQLAVVSKVAAVLTVVGRAVGAGVCAVLGGETTPEPEGAGR
jgi:hypothetical protein